MTNIKVFLKVDRDSLKSIGSNIKQNKKMEGLQ